MIVIYCHLLCQWKVEKEQAQGEKINNFFYIVGWRCFLDIQVEMPSRWVGIQRKCWLEVHISKSLECNLYDTKKLWLIECQEKLWRILKMNRPRGLLGIINGKICLVHNTFFWVIWFYRNFGFYCLWAILQLCKF